VRKAQSGASGVKLRGGPSLEGSGGFHMHWEWLWLACAAVLTFVVSRIVAYRHRIKRYFYRSRGFDFDK
jgi:hypothetical protein